jgi:polar amino acid transport system substrate-binding protein
MRNKVLAVVLGVAMAAALLTGCGSKGEPKEEAGGTEEEADEAGGEDTSLEDIQGAGVMTVGMCPEYPPFESINASGDIEGFDADLANEIGKILGVEVEFVNTPYEGLIAGLMNGDFDIIMSGMSPEEADEADKTLNVTENYYSVAEVILSKDDSIQSKEDLEGKTVGSHSGSTSEYAVDSLADEDIHVTSAPYNRHSEAFADLQNGNIDAQVVEETWAKEKVADGDGIHICEEPINSINVAGVIGSGRDSFRDAFNDALKQLKDDGTYDEIVEKWFS